MDQDQRYPANRTGDGSQHSSTPNATGPIVPVAPILAGATDPHQQSGTNGASANGVQSGNSSSTSAAGAARVEYEYAPVQWTAPAQIQPAPATPAKSDPPSHRPEQVAAQLTTRLAPESAVTPHAATPAAHYPPTHGPVREAGRPGGTGINIGMILRRTWPLLLLVLAKGKYLLFLLKFKAFGTFVTMLISLAFYATAFGLPFAAGFIALLFIHEMGHAIVLKRQGVQATAPLFIPFMGAFIGMKELPANAYREAQMALGGPLLGSVGALACLILWQATGSPLFVALAYVGCWLNLFNLIPVSPLDGGRAMAAISPYGWLLGLVLLLLLFLRLHSLFLGFILLVGGMEVFQRWQQRGHNRAYYQLTSRQRLTIAATYFGLAALLALSMAALQPHLLTNQPGR